MLPTHRLAYSWLVLIWILASLGCQGVPQTRGRLKNRRQQSSEFQPSNDTLRTLGENVASARPLQLDAAESPADSNRSHAPLAKRQLGHERKNIRWQSPEQTLGRGEIGDGSYFGVGQSDEWQIPTDESGYASELSMFAPNEWMTQTPEPNRDADLGFWATRWQAVKQDYRNLYSPQGLTRLLLGFSAGAAMAHTNFDRFVTDDLFRENILGASIDEWAEVLHEPKFIGDGYLTIPLFIGLSVAEPLWDEYQWGQTVSTWGARSARTILLGGPVLLLSQTIVGGSRPHEASSGSHWTPFQDNNGVSGHSFMGAIPFLTAAKMTDNRWAKVLLYTGSALPALSRINDERHYASQAFLGWYLAYVAADMVHRTDRGERYGSWSPWVTSEGVGVMWEKKF
jgi:hypothetical protein